MKQKLWFILVLIFSLGLVLIWQQRAFLISTIVSKEYKIPLSIGKIDLGKNLWNIYGIRVENSKGYHPKYAFLSRKIEIYFEKPWIPASKIKSCKIEKAVINIDCTNVFCNENNWNLILKEAQKKKIKESSEIKLLDLVDLTINIDGHGIGKGFKTLHFDHLKIENISSESDSLLELMIQEIFKSAGIEVYLKGSVKIKGLFKRLF